MLNKSLTINPNSLRLMILQVTYLRGLKMPELTEDDMPVIEL
jgi:hypothetical protein